jgi:hypothetical protein
VRPGGSSWRPADRARIGTVVTALALLLSGCSSGPGPAGGAGGPGALEVLRLALDGWKAGKTPAVLKDGSPSIAVSDRDWDSGYRLVAYQLIGEGEGASAGVLCAVRLRLRPPQGREIKREALYAVALRPAVTVTRQETR